jgi:hypothetical protein
VGGKKVGRTKGEGNDRRGLGRNKGGKNIVTSNDIRKEDISTTKKKSITGQRKYQRRATNR